MIAGHYIHCSANWNALPADADGTLYGGALPAEQIIFINRPDRNWIRTIYDMQGRIVTS